MQYSFNDSLTWLKNLLSINSVEQAALPGYPFGEGVGKALEYSLGLMQKLGFKTKNVDGYCGWAEIGQGELFGILVHLDVVPEGDGWTFPPFGAVTENGNIYARGAIDDKGPFIASLYAVVKLLQQGLTPNKRIRFILGCDEESGWKCMERYVQTEEMPAVGISPDADFPVINCEKGIVYHKLSFPLPNGIYDIHGGQRGNMVPASAFCQTSYHHSIEKRAKEKNIPYKIKDTTIVLQPKGFSSHGSHPEKGDNALYKLFYCLSDVYPIFQNLYEAFYAGDGKAINLNLSDEKSGKLTLNLGTCKIIDKNIVCELDIRHPISYNKDEITSLLTKNLPCKIEQCFFHYPLYIDEQHPLVQTLLNAYDAITKPATPSKPIAIGGGTYARALPVGVAFGPLLPGMVSTMHEKDEYISIEHFDILIQIYYKAIKELCFL